MAKAICSTLSFKQSLVGLPGSGGQFTVKMAEASDSERLFTIYCLSGQALYNEMRDGYEMNAEFNLSSLPAGNYVLAVSSGKKIIDTRKFIKR